MAKKRSLEVTLCILVISAWIFGFTTQVGAQPNLGKLIGTWKLISVETVLTNGEAIFEWMG
jgi:hypothetical protein